MAGTTQEPHVGLDAAALPLRIPVTARFWLLIGALTAVPIAWCTSLVLLGGNRAVWAACLTALAASLSCVFPLRRLAAMRKGDPVTAPKSFEWWLRRVAWVVAGFTVALGRHEPVTALGGLAGMLLLLASRSLGIERFLPPASPFASRRSAAVTEDASASTVMPHHPVVENLIGLLTAMVFLVLSYTFLVEAFRIPTGSMEPTLFGHPVMGDRAIVDKQAYQFGDPKPGDIAVFRFPQNRSQPYVKRLSGTPGETVVILNGDLWVQGPDDPAPRLRPKPEHVQESAWLEHLRFEGGAAALRTRFLGEKGEASAEGDVITLKPGSEGVAAIRYPREGSIMNHYPLEGSPRAELAYGTEAVGDLRVDFTAELAEGAELVISLRRNDREDVSEWIRTSGAHGISTVDGIDTPGPRQITERRNPQQAVDQLFALRKQAGQPIDLTSNEDLDAMQKAVGRLESSSVHFEARGGEVRITGLRICRDFHYLGRTPFVRLGENDDLVQQGKALPGMWSPVRGPTMPMSFRLGQDEYLMLGDHTEDSADSRAWFVADLTLVGDRHIVLPLQEIFQGPDAKAKQLRNYWYGRCSNALLRIPGSPEPAMLEEGLLAEMHDGGFGQRISFPDIHGIPRTVDPNDVTAINISHAPGVPRDFIDGRLLGSLFPRPRFVE